MLFGQLVSVSAARCSEPCLAGLEQVRERRHWCRRTLLCRNITFVTPAASGATCFFLLLSKLFFFKACSVLEGVLHAKRYVFFVKIQQLWTSIVNRCLQCFCITRIRYFYFLIPCWCAIMNFKLDMKYWHNFRDTTKVSGAIFCQKTPTQNLQFHLFVSIWSAKRKKLICKSAVRLDGKEITFYWSNHSNEY